MLQVLDIRDFALIESVRIDWASGLNVLTGETGAGKSIIIDALNIVLGGKAAPTDIRTGAQRAGIEATFKPEPSVMSWLKSNELLPDDETQYSVSGDDASRDLSAGGTPELIIAREISRTGSRARINGIAVNLTLLQELRQKLLTIHAQHEARSLLAPQMQLELLDGLGTPAGQALLDQIRKLHARWREIKASLKELEASEQERTQKLGYAVFQFKELEQAALKDDDEFEIVQAAYKRLSSIAQLETSTLAASDLLTGLDSDQKRAVDLVQEAILHIERVSECDSTLGQLGESLKGALDQLEEAARALRRYRESLQMDPQALAELESRLNLLAGIKRKYGPTLAEAIARRDKSAKDIEQLENSESTISKLRQELNEVDTELTQCSENLSRGRKDTAVKLAKSILHELADLGMEACKFEINFEKTEPSPEGMDTVEMLIAPNPGQPLLPVSKIASGGELSRVMLAIKSIFAKVDKVSTVVFDEIDAGLSGKVLQSVRDKLVGLSKSHQILCITHQPMIASVADNHIQINKAHSKNATSISVTTLEQKDRVRIVASMASGYDDQQEALRFAEALINEALTLRSPG